MALAGSRRRRLALVLLWAVATLFFFWTDTSSGDAVRFNRPQADYYNLQVDGFLEGHLSLSTSAPNGLVVLADPYDPAENFPFQAALHDLAYYRGHLYLTWGPTPAVTLFLPWRLLGLGPIQQSFAVFIFAAVGLGFVLATLELLVSRYLPATGGFRILLAGTPLALSSVVPYLLRRPQVYEVAISCGYCFIGAGLFFLLGALARRRFERWRLGMGSLALALAVGARPDLAPSAALLAVVFVVSLRSAPVRPRRELILRAGALLGPFLVGIAVLGWFNWARFGNPMQIGSAYQLAGFDPTKTPYYELGYLAPSLYYYLIAPVRFTLAFPFVALPPPPAYPGAVPSTYLPEIIGGLLTTTPVLVALGVAPVVLRRRLRSELALVCGLLGGVGLLTCLLIAFAVPGGTMRYEVDFATLLLLPAMLGVLAIRPFRRGAATAMSIVWTVLVGYGAAVGVAVSLTGPDDEMQLSNPVAYQRLEQLASPLPTLVTMLIGHPKVVRVIDPYLSYPDNLGDYGTYEAGRRFPLFERLEEVDVVSPSTGTALWSSTIYRTASAPARGKIIVAMKDGNVIVDFRFHPGRDTVALHLQRGLNRLYVGVQIELPPRGSAPELLTVENLSFTTPTASARGTPRDG